MPRTYTFSIENILARGGEVSGAVFASGSSANLRAGVAVWYVPYMSSSPADRRAKGLCYFNCWLPKRSLDILANMARRSLRSRTQQLQFMLDEAENQRRSAAPDIGIPPQDEMQAILDAWPRDRDLLSRQLIIGAPDESLDGLRAAVARLCGRSRPGPVRIGQALRREAGTWHGHRRLVWVRNGKGFCLWCVEDASSAYEPPPEAQEPAAAANAAPPAATAEEEPMLYPELGF